MGDDSSDSSRADTDSPAGPEPVERSFTCTACGYGMVHSVGPLRAEVQSTCHNCGDWTLQAAAVEAVVDAARDVADRLAGTILTERQGLAYLLRDVVGLDRQRTAAAMDTTPSNVDNLHRRGREKVADARRLLAELRSVQADADPAGEATS